MKKKMIIIGIIMMIVNVISAIMIYKTYNYKLTIINKSNGTKKEVIVKRNTPLKELLDEEKDFLCFTDKNNDVLNNEDSVFLYDEVNILYQNVDSKHVVYYLYDDKKTKVEIIDDDKVLNEPSIPFRLSGNFKYWSLDGKIFDFNTPIKSDLRLVAVWEEYNENNFSDLESNNYSINLFYRYGQKIVYNISDKTIIDIKEEELFRDASQVGGGYNKVYTISGLKKGKTFLTMEKQHGDGDVISSESYYFNVDKNLNISLIKNNNYLFQIDNSIYPVVKSSVSNEEIASLTEKKVRLSSSLKKEGVTEFVLEPKKEGNVNVTLNIYDSDGKYLSKFVYHFIIDNQLNVINDGLEKIE